MTQKSHTEDRPLQNYNSIPMPAFVIDEVARKATPYLEDLNHYKLDPIWHSTLKEPNIYAFQGSTG